MKLKEELLCIADCFNRAEIDYALCGGLAVVAHGFPRLTKDIDILIRREDLEQAKLELAKVEYDLEGGMIRFDQNTPKERLLFRVSRAEGNEIVTLDLMLVMPIYESVWDSRERIELDGRALKIVSRSGLISMKQVAGRPQDIADIEALKGLESP
jgi:predicted nucleotidyltransferase